MLLADDRDAFVRQVRPRLQTRPNLPSRSWATASPLPIPLACVRAHASSTCPFPPVVTKVVRVATRPEEQSRLSAAALAHWRRLLAEDSTASDLLPILALACDVLASPAASRPMPSPVVPAQRAAATSPRGRREPPTLPHPHTSLATDLASARSVTSASSYCFGGVPRAIYVSMHSAPAPTRNPSPNCNPNPNQVACRPQSAC